MDNAWVTKTGELVEGTSLELPFLNLVFAWREASYVHQLPWLMVEQMKTYAESASIEHRPFNIRLVDLIKSHLVDRMSGDLSLTNRKKLGVAVEELHGRVQAMVKTTNEGFPATEYWDELCRQTAFQLSISGTQGMVFCSLYFAYENFLPEAYWAVTGDRATTTKEAKIFAKKFEMCFGPVVLEYCIQDQIVEIARLTRNDYAHNGCRAGAKLLALPHGLWIDPATGQFTIAAVNTISLYQNLRARVDRLIQEVNSLLPTGHAV